MYYTLCTAKVKGKQAPIFNEFLNAEQTANDDYTLQTVARLVVLFFYFFIPASIYFSLQQIH